MLINTKVSSKLKIKKLEDLIDMPVIITVTKFNDESVSKFMEGIYFAQNTKQPIIPIVIDSFGGQCYSVLAMMDMIDAVKKSKIPVATIVLGKAMSCGSILSSCGTEGYRFMSPNATMMIHDASCVTAGKTEEVKTDAKELDRLNDKIYAILAKNTGKPAKYFSDLVHDKGRADWFLTPEECMSHNLINHISVPEFNISINVKVEFNKGV